MNVLIATPTYGSGPCPETCASVAALEGPGWEWRRYRANAWPAPDKRNVLAQYQAIREDFLSGSWDALLTVEHDMIPPPHALTALWETGAPVAYGVYLLRHGALVLNALGYVGTRNLGESLSLHRRGTLPAGVVRVSGVGFGCTLIRRAVVERFPFNDGGDVGQSPDLPFALDCVRAGVVQVAHFGVLCGHIDKGRVLMPGRDDVTARVALTMRQTINARVDGQVTRLEAGETYQVPVDEARELSRAGYGEVVDATGDRDAHDGKPTADAGAQPAKPKRAKRS